MDFHAMSSTLDAYSSELDEMQEEGTIAPEQAEDINNLISHLCQARDMAESLAAEYDRIEVLNEKAKATNAVDPDLERIEDAAVDALHRGHGLPTPPPRKAKGAGK
jgi:hypothetical protein